MSIVHRTGNILTSKTNAIVIPVNMVGVMGKGLAKEWKDTCAKEWKYAYQEYLDSCNGGNLDFDYPVFSGKWVFFATKNDWREKSKLENIKRGLDSFFRPIWGAEPIEKSMFYDGIAFPPIGCGLGGLDQNDLYPLMDEFAEKVHPRKVELWNFEVKQNKNKLL